MIIEAQSLAPYIYSLGIKGVDEIESVWREILKFPNENWTATNGESDTVLDPSRVLARMLCVKIDRLLGDWIKSKAKSEDEIPLSWLLRITPLEKWKPGDVLIFTKLRSAGLFDEDFYEIEKWFPSLFEDLQIGGKPPANPSVKKLEGIIRDFYPTIGRGKMIHVSVPKFHKVWDYVFPSDNTSSTAKRQWSMTINGIFERICNEVSGADANILQSGGGHLLVLLAENEDPKGYAEDFCSRISSKFMKNHGWCPLIWASWDTDYCRKWSSPQKKQSDIINQLETDYEDSQATRDQAKRKWAIFKEGKSEDVSDISKSRKPKMATFYLDVINLGDYCWPGKSPDRDIIEGSLVKFSSQSNQNSRMKRYIWPEEKRLELALITKVNPTKDFYQIRFLDESGGNSNQEIKVVKDVVEIASSDDFSQKNPSIWPVPTRNKKEAITGFTRSRKITPVIESTFGLIFSKHHPSSVDAMGGDEIIFTMEASKYSSLIENIEKHTLHLHKTIFDEQQRMLWWAMCSVDETPSSYSEMKSTVRERTISNSVTLSRFVNPLWTEFL